LPHRPRAGPQRVYPKKPSRRASARKHFQVNSTLVVPSQIAHLGVGASSRVTLCPHTSPSPPKHSLTRGRRDRELAGQHFGQRATRRSRPRRPGPPATLDPAHQWEGVWLNPSAKRHVRRRRAGAEVGPLQWTASQPPASTLPYPRLDPVVVQAASHPAAAAAALCSPLTTTRSSSCCRPGAVIADRQGVRAGQAALSAVGERPCPALSLSHGCTVRPAAVPPRRRRRGTQNGSSTRFLARPGRPRAGPRDGDRRSALRSNHFSPVTLQPSPSPVASRRLVTGRWSEPPPPRSSTVPGSRCPERLAVTRGSQSSAERPCRLPGGTAARPPRRHRDRAGEVADSWAVEVQQGVPDTRVPAPKDSLRHAE